MFRFWCVYSSIRPPITRLSVSLPSYHVCLYLSVCLPFLSVSLCVCLSVCLPFLSVSLCVCLSVWQSVFKDLTVHPSVSLSVWLSICLSDRISVSAPQCPSGCLFVSGEVIGLSSKPSSSLVPEQEALLSTFHSSAPTSQHRSFHHAGMHVGLGRGSQFTAHHCSSHTKTGNPDWVWRILSSDQGIAYVQLLQGQPPSRP